VRSQVVRPLRGLNVSLCSTASPAGRPSRWKVDYPHRAQNTARTLPATSSPQWRQGRVSNGASGRDEEARGVENIPVAGPAVRSKASSARSQKKRRPPVS